MSLDAVKTCPNHAICFGYTQTPLPDKGFWVDHSDYKYAGNIYRCAWSTCKGGTNGSSCWTVNGFNATGCNDDQCTQGSGGPLCASCANGYIRSPATKACELCSENWVLVVSIFGALIFILLLAVLMMQMGQLTTTRGHFTKCMKYVDSGTLKVIWVTYQIVVSSSFAMDIQVRFHIHIHFRVFIT
jgi:hypothetical protein